MLRADRSWFTRSSPEIARALIGQSLVHITPQGRLVGRIVETEAYLGLDDAASHASLYRSGLAKLTRTPGTIYMYRAYGVHAMFNIVADSPGTGGAVLIRAVEPLEGIEEMRVNRGGLPDRLLTSGPGKLCQAMGFRLEHDGLDAASHPAIRIELTGETPVIECSPRIGITKNVEPLLRYYEPTSAYVSGARKNRTGLTP